MDTTGYRQGFAKLANPLFAGPGGMQPLEWTETEQRGFKALKSVVVSALALALSDITKSLSLYMGEARGAAYGELIQTLEPWKNMMMHLSKRLNLVTI